MIDYLETSLTSIQPERAQSVVPVVPMGLRAPRLMRCSAAFVITKVSRYKRGKYEQ